VASGKRLAELWHWGQVSAVAYSRPGGRILLTGSRADGKHHGQARLWVVNAPAPDQPDRFKPEWLRAWVRWQTGSTIKTINDRGQLTYKERQQMWKLLDGR
jgi:hypothetical protein